MRRSLLAGLFVCACKDEPAHTGDESSGGAHTSTTTTTTASTGDSSSGAPDTSTGEPGPDCVADPPPEALLRMGPNPDGTLLVAGGRRITPAGTTTMVAGFPADIAVHPTLDLAYITSTARYER